jgi:very-short-patch-repair endonuclease
MAEQIPKSVKDVLHNSANLVGNFTRDNWEPSLFYECQDTPFGSPIEMMFYIGFKTLRHLLEEQADDIEIVNNENFIRGTGIDTQFKAGKYRADFRIFKAEIHKGPQQVIHEAVIECDSQQFHERTEQERRYEKARDRWFNKEGYTVLHYTGKEIIEDPFLVAADAMSHIINLEPKELYEYIKAYRGV